MGEREKTNEPPRESVTAGLPSFVSYYTDEDGRPINTALLYSSFMCQECETIKADVIGYTLPTIFLDLSVMRWDYLIKCRRCMRRHIMSRLWLAVLLSHVLSPLIITWWGAVFVQTFFRKPG